MKHSHTRIYLQEKRREKFLESEDIQNFLNTYKGRSINHNTGKFWDDKFSEEKNIKNQDGITQDKIKFIASYIFPLRQLVKLLDIGIGQAYLEQELERQKIKSNLSTVDISKLSIDRARKKFKAKGHVKDALKINKLFKENSFDVIVAIEVIEHISPNSIFSFYKKVHSLLKTEGIFIISTPTNEGLSLMNENPNAHVREYTIPILKAEFKLSNFKIIKIKTLYAFKTFYRLKKIISKISKDRWRPNNVIIVARKL